MSLSKVRLLGKLILLGVVITATLLPPTGWAWHRANHRLNHSAIKWKVYSNATFNFSIEYTRSWKAIGNEGEGNPAVIICPRNPKPHEFYITVGTERRTLDEVRASYV